MGRQTKTRLLTAGVLVTVFGAGILLGFAANTMLTASPAAAIVPGTGSVEVDGKEPDEPRRIPMYEQVGPDSAQSVTIDSIVAEHRARLDQLNREFQKQYDPRMRAIVEETREAIKGVFTSEQAARYQELLDARDRSRAEGPDDGEEDQS